MKDLLTMDWMGKSIVVAIAVGLFPFLMTSMAQKGMKPEITLAWWMVGVSSGIFMLVRSGGLGLTTGNMQDFFPSTWMIVLVIAIGITAGAAMNTLYGQAIQQAPNPALAIGVINASVVLAYVFAPLLHKLSPSTFPFASVNWTGFGGVLLTVAGLVLIAKAK